MSPRSSSSGQPFTYYVPGMDPDRSLWNLLVGISYLIIWVVGIPVLAYAGIRWWSDQGETAKPVREKVTATKSWTFDRQDLRNSNMFSEQHVHGAHPRTLFRELKREVQEITGRNGFKYTTREPDGTNPSIIDEEVGQQSGRVVGRFTATTDWQQFRQGEPKQQSLPLLPLVLGLLGLLVLLAGAAMDGNEQAVVIVVGILLLLLATYLYYRHGPSTAAVAFEYRKRVRVLVEGEIGEQVPTEEGPASLSATDLGVIIGEDIETRRRGPSAKRRLPLTEFSAEMREQLGNSVTPLPSEIDLRHASPEMFSQRAIIPT